MGAQSDDLAPGEVDTVLGRIRDLIQGAIDRLEPDDLRQRIRFCRSTGEHGASIHRNGDKVTAWWGGKPLIDIDRASLAVTVPDDPGGVA